MKLVDSMQCKFSSRSVNEGLARGVLAAFLAQADPTVEQLADLKTTLSEAVTNCIVHAYPNGLGEIVLTCKLYEGGCLKLVVVDRGVGIANIAQAMEPTYTTGDPAERAGLGFAVMQSFADKVRVHSVLGKGTRVTLTKQLSVRA